jgi:3-oxoacyl-[acyl-carrier-protein] synthase III
MFSDAIGRDLGIEQVPVYSGQNRTDPAITAANESLLKAKINPEEIGAIIDFSVLPEDYVVPSWCISNRIQAEIGAVNAFNIGCGGNGTTNLLVALQFACSLIKSGQIKTALLVASDVAIKNNRVVKGKNSPLTIIGDGASALLVAEGDGLCEILEIELGSDGSRHDIYLIRGGGLAFPDRKDLYTIHLDYEKLDLRLAWGNVKTIADELLKRQGLTQNELAYLIFPGISKINSKVGYDIFNMTGQMEFENNRTHYGHLHGTDIILNLSIAVELSKDSARKVALLCSHGWGFTYGAALIKV